MDFYYGFNPFREETRTHAHIFGYINEVSCVMLRRGGLYKGALKSRLGGMYVITFQLLYYMRDVDDLKLLCMFHQ